MSRPILAIKASLAWTILALVGGCGGGGETPGNSDARRRATPGREAVEVRKVDLPPTPQVWAVVIGVDGYEDRRIPACSSAVHDARAVLKWLVGTAGWSRRNVLLMHDGAPEQHGHPRDEIEELKVTRDNLDWAVTRWLKARLRPDDVAVIYFAGQAIGLPPEVGSPEGAAGRAYLLPIGARIDNLDRTGWSLDSALDELAARPPGAGAGSQRPDATVVCLLDTSLAGRGKRIAADVDVGVSSGSDDFLGKLARWPGVSAWLAADAAPAREMADAEGRSPFVAAIIRALGSARRPRSLLACLDELLREPTLRDQGFRRLGGIAPEASLWPERIRRLSRVRPEPLLQRGHADRITAVAFTTPDGSRMVTASRDSAVKIWSWPDRLVLGALPGDFHLLGVTGLAAGPDGRWLVSGDGAGRVWAWDLVEHARKDDSGPTRHAKPVARLDALPDGLHFVSVDLGGGVWLWDVSGDELKATELARGAVVACAATSGRVALAVAEGDGTGAFRVRLFGPDGGPLETVDAPGGPITCLGLSPDGGTLAVGRKDGLVSVRDLESGRLDADRRYGGAVRQLALSPSGRMVVGTDAGCYLDAPDGDGVGIPPLLAGPIQQVNFSPDGRTLAACTKAGAVHAWAVPDRGAVRGIPLDPSGPKPDASAVTLAIAPDGRALVSGDADGGFRSWDLGTGVLHQRQRPGRGRVASLSASADRRYLLQVTRDWNALVWDLQEGRGPIPIPGRWTSGVITPDGRDLVLTSHPDGRLVAVERGSGRPRATAFEPPPAPVGAGASPFGPTNVSGGSQMLALSGDGRRVAATCQWAPLACVWDAQTGKLLQVIDEDDHRRPITAVDLSADGALLLTADGAGMAKLWELSGGQDPKLLRAFEADEASPLSAARIGPTGSGVLVTGDHAGRVLLWDVATGRPRVIMGILGRAIRALAFTSDGRRLVAAGGDKRLTSWEMGRPADEKPLDSLHAERISALIPWPDDPAPTGRRASLVVSGSDDTSVRFWNPEAGTLMGSLSAVRETSEADPEAAGATGPPTNLSWVVFTPDGLFDSSPGGEALVSWLSAGRVMTLEQSHATARVFRLSDWLRRGERPESPRPPPGPPPRLAIDPPPRAVFRGSHRTVELSLSLGEPGLTDLRLYHNGRPIRRDEDFDRTPDGRRIRVKVPLDAGANRLYAMASREGSVDGRSNEVELRYEGPELRGRLHVVALGVGDYENYALEFAARDAESIAALLRDRGLQPPDRKGEQILLTDRAVNRDELAARFERLREAVRDHPEDTVVLFIAGHTDVLEDGYYLLLSSFPFPEGPRVALARGGFPKAGARRAERAPSATDLLPFAWLYHELSRLGALQRLVIIDACRAEAALQDPVVRLLEHADRGAQIARTNYLLAARPGELAGEARELKHGLLTYAILHGLGAPLEPRAALPIFERWPHADLDRDDEVDSEELGRYVDATLPELAARFPPSQVRQGEARDPDLPTSPRVQSTGGRPFRLVRVREE